MAKHSYNEHFLLVHESSLWTAEYDCKSDGATIKTYRAFHGFGQAKFPDGGSVLGSSKLKLLPQLS